MREDRIVVAGDWHGDTQWGGKAVRLTRTAWNCDLLVHLGDFGIWPGPGGDRYLNGINRAAEEANVHVWVVPGNHEDYDQIDRLPTDDNGLLVLRDRIRLFPRAHWFTLNGVSLLALGGAVSIDRNIRKVGESWWMQEAITPLDVEKVAAVVAANGSPDVMLTHECPAGVDFGYGMGGPTWFTPEVRHDSNHQRVLLRNALDHATPGYLVHGHHHRVHAAVIEGVGYDGQEYATRVLGLSNERAPGNIALLDLNPDDIPKVTGKFPLGAVKKQVMQQFNATYLP